MRTHSSKSRCVLYRGESGKVVAHERPLLPSRRAALEGTNRRRLHALHVPRHEVRPDRANACRSPARTSFRPSSRVRSYPVVERDHLVWIWMGDPAKADPAQIIDFPYLQRPAAGRVIPAYMHYDANYLLIVDNLSDFAHLAFVHTKTLGGSEEYAYVTKPIAIERLERRLPGRALAHEQRLLRRSTRRSSRTRLTRSTGATSAPMNVPGIFFMETLFAPAGTGAEKGNIAGDRAVPQLPVHDAGDARTTHFFWDYLNDYEREDPNIRAVALDSLHRGLHGGQGDHRDAAADARRATRTSDAGDRRRRASGAFPPRLRSTTGGAAGGEDEQRHETVRMNRRRNILLLALS